MRSGHVVGHSENALCQKPPETALIDHLRKVLDRRPGFERGGRRRTVGGVHLVNERGAIPILQDEQLEMQVGIQARDGVAARGVGEGVYAAVHPAGGAIDAVAFLDAGLIDQPTVACSRGAPAASVTAPVAVARSSANAGAATPMTKAVAVARNLLRIQSLVSLDAKK